MKGANGIPSEDAEQCFLWLCRSSENRKIILQAVGLEFFIDKFKGKWDNEVGDLYAFTLRVLADINEDVNVKCGKPVVNICLRMLRLREPSGSFGLLSKLIEYPPNADVVLTGGNGLPIIVAATKKYKDSVGFKILGDLAKRNNAINATILTELGELLLEKIYQQDVFNLVIWDVAVNSISVCCYHFIIFLIISK